MKFDIKPLQQLLKNRGLEKGGIVQRVIDADTLKYLEPYMPKDSGTLIKSGNLSTKIGSGVLEYSAPYAKVLYYGKVMVSPSTGSAWAEKGEKKVLTDLDFKYKDSPQRGSFSLERMKADHAHEILNSAAQVAGGKAK